jgi:hypothetical protein
MPLKEIPSAVASKVASSTRVEIAEVTPFHSSGDFVRATNTKLTYLAALTDFKHCDKIKFVKSVIKL